MNNTRINSFIGVTIGILVIFSLLNIYLLNIRYDKIAEAEVIAKEIMRPAVIQVIKLTSSDCEDCFDIEKAVASLKNQNVNVTEETILDISGKDAQDIIKEYNLIKIPALIIKGELNKSESLMNFYEKNGKIIDLNTTIYTNIQPPYYDVAQQRVVGRVMVFNIIDPSCTQCVSLVPIETALSKAGVQLVKTAPYTYDSEEGKGLVAKYGITRIPAMLIAQEIDVYDAVKNEIKALAGAAKNGNYVIHSLQPPYVDLQKNAVVGLVTLTLLSDKSCTTCYDARINEQIVQQFGIVLNKVNAYDISDPEGKELVTNYKITKVPALIVSADVDTYSSFKQVWQNVGTIEDDGTYVMRNPQVLGTYKDLTTNKVVETQNAPAS